jgi:hypothetical protein
LVFLKKNLKVEFVLNILILFISYITDFFEKQLIYSFYMTDYLATKSKMNKSAGELLQKQAIFCSSIHCYYYCCIQRILSELYALYTKQQMLIDRRENYVNASSHEYYKLKFTSEIDGMTGITRKHITDFYQKFSQLKALRNNSDYENEEISAEHANSAKNLLDDLLAIINLI